CCVKPHREPAKHANKRPHLAPRVFIAAVKVGNGIKDNTAYLVRSCDVLYSAKTLRGLNPTIRPKLGNDSILTGKIDQLEAHQFSAGNLQVFCDLFEPEVDLVRWVLGANIEDIACVDLVSEPFSAQHARDSQLQRKRCLPHCSVASKQRHLGSRKKPFDQP